MHTQMCLQARHLQCFMLSFLMHAPPADPTCSTATMGAHAGAHASSAAPTGGSTPRKAAGGSSSAPTSASTPAESGDAAAAGAATIAIVAAGATAAAVFVFDMWCSCTMNKDGGAASSMCCTLVCTLVVLMMCGVAGDIKSAGELACQHSTDQCCQREAACIRDWRAPCQCCCTVQTIALLWPLVLTVQPTKQPQNRNGSRGA